MAPGLATSCGTPHPWADRVAVSTRSCTGSVHANRLPSGDQLGWSSLGDVPGDTWTGWSPPSLEATKTRLSPLTIA